jgi:hypothetical protein
VGQLKVCNGELGFQEPNYEEIEHYEAIEITCDGRDNDCETSFNILC